MTGLHMEQEDSTQIFGDNQAAISITNDSVFHSKTKHFKIKLFSFSERFKGKEKHYLLVVLPIYLHYPCTTRQHQGCCSSKVFITS
ncbi:hypothetical protein CR513_04529, partial [Mucuna pruriens]